MIYECDKCGAELPPAVTACPNCGDPFEEAVPADAEVPKERSAARPTSPPAADQVLSIPAPPQPPDRVPRYARKGIGSVATIGVVILAVVFVRGIKYWDRPAGALPVPSRASSQIAPRPPNPAPSEITTPPTSDRPALEVLNHMAGSGGSGETFIAGKVRNNTDRTLGHAQITFNIYDRHNKRIGAAEDSTNSLKPHGIWAYKVTFLKNKSAAYYKLAGVTGQ